MVFSQTSAVWRLVGDYELLDSFKLSWFAVNARPSDDYTVAKNDEEEATFKKYKRFDSTRILHPLNPKYPDIVLNMDLEYRIVGVMMEKKRYK